MAGLIGSLEPGRELGQTQAVSAAPPAAPVVAPLSFPVAPLSLLVLDPIAGPRPSVPAALLGAALFVFSPAPAAAPGVLLPDIPHAVLFAAALPATVAPAVAF